MQRIVCPFIALILAHAVNRSLKFIDLTALTNETLIVYWLKLTALIVGRATYM